MAKHSRKFDMPAPSLDPPQARAQLYAVRAGAAAPAPEPLPETYMEESAAARALTPTLTPPGEAEAAAAEEAAVAVWFNNKKIEALWSDASVATPNSQVSVAGVGWTRIASTNESAVVDMSLMAAHAEATNASVHLRVEADNMVHELYVW